ncbi:MAG: restriction endonuclease subunit S [Ruminococcus sp.]|nr:restriction endonuclease subunit S [Ruminococcus sp.]
MSELQKLINELCPDGVEYKELQEILTIKNGSDYKKFGNGDIPVYGSGGIIAYIDRFVFDKPSVLIPRKGSVDKLYYVDTPFWNVDTIFYTDIDNNKAIPKYVYYCLSKEHLEKYNNAGGVPSLTQKILNKVKIPAPPLEIQKEIVRILDNYSEKNEELIKSLYKEIELRKKQYEYYRDKLLTFD